MLRIILLICLLTFCFAGNCYSDSTVKIGGAFALTGFANSFGTVELNGARLAIAEANASADPDDPRFELVVEDTGSSNKNTVTAVSKLISVDGLKFIVGPTWLDSFAGAAPIANRKNVMLFTPSAVPQIFKRSPDQFPFIFSSFFNMETEISTLLKRVESDGIQKVAFMFDQDPFWVYVTGMMKSASKELGITVLKIPLFAPGETDFRTPLIDLKKRGAEAVLFGFVDEAATLSFLKQHKSICPELSLYGTHDVDGLANQKEFKDLLKGAIYVVPQSPKAEFVEKYKKKYKTEPVLTASNAYDATRMLIESFNSAAHDPSKVSQYLLSNEFTTSSFGKTTFSKWGGIESGQFEVRIVK